MINSVLLIDDDKVTNFLHERIIAKLVPTKDVTTAVNGREALNFLIQRSSEGKSYPSLILVDINMPIMDGFEFLETFDTIRSTDTSVIILMLTTSSNNNDIKKANQYKINGYLNKPLTEEKVKNIIKEYF